MNDKFSFYRDNGSKINRLIQKAIAKHFVEKNNSLSKGMQYGNLLDSGNSVENAIMVNEEIRLRNEILMKL